MNWVNPNRRDDVARACFKSQPENSHWEAEKTHDNVPPHRMWTTYFRNTFETHNGATIPVLFLCELFINSICVLYWKEKHQWEPVETQSFLLGLPIQRTVSNTTNCVFLSEYQIETIPLSEEIRGKRHPASLSTEWKLYFSSLNFTFISVLQVF
jgi:hypothetical protein